MMILQNLFLNTKLDKVTKLFITSILVVFIFACQSNNKYVPIKAITSNTINFSQYYLSLKNLTEIEIKNEIAQQREKKSQGSIEAEINLILLHSLPNSPIHNAYTAKSKLNEQFKNHQNYYLNTADQAFINLLKDQLNQQLFLFQKLINQELEHDSEMAKQRIAEQKQLNKVAELELSVSQLTEKINQLKKIEQSISEHGQ